MGARRKLNGAMLNGCALLAGALGVLSGSWTVFWVSLAVSIVAALCSGDIRPKPQKHP